VIQQNSLTVSTNQASRGSVTLYSRAAAFALVVVTSLGFLAMNAYAQTSKQPGNTRPASKQRHRLRITDGDIMGVSLKADKAKMTEIAADLAKRLRTPVNLGPSLKTEALTVEFVDLTFESAMALIAPRVLVDYEIRANAKPKALAIYLMGFDDPDPAKNETVQSPSEAMMFEGNTEDEPASSTEPQDDPLQVDLENNLLTIRSKKQPLIAVILTIAEVLEVPTEIKHESREIIDTVIKDTPFEDAITRLSPDIRLYVRADLTRWTRMPLRVRLVAPEKVEVQ